VIYWSASRTTSLCRRPVARAVGALRSSSSLSVDPSSMYSTALRKCAIIYVPYQNGAEKFQYGIEDDATNCGGRDWRGESRQKLRDSSRSHASEVKSNHPDLDFIRIQMERPDHSEGTQDQY
jgi:hypothetical protein